HIHLRSGTRETTPRAMLAALHACKLVTNATPRTGLDQVSLVYTAADWSYADEQLDQEPELVDLSFDCSATESQKERKRAISVKGILDKLFTGKAGKYKLTSYKKIGVGIASVVLVGILCTFLMMSSPLETAQRSIEAGNYRQFEKAYKALDSKEQRMMLETMKQDLTQKVEQYAANELTTAEIAEVLAAYRNIPEMAAAAAAAYQNASALEISKSSYQKGLYADSVLERLEYWRSVTRADTGSTEAMNKDLMENREVYKEQMFLCLTSQSDKTALSYLYLLQSFYGNDADIARRITELQDKAFSATLEQSVPPIRITKFTLQQPDNTGWNTVYLDWMNCTNKTIANIIFELYPYDQSNQQVMTQMDTGDGLYSKYQAKFEGPILGGQAVTGYYFLNVWYNPHIATARVDSVTITYADGSTSTLFTPEAIEALFAVH
ncbi:MAG: hypothetical protein IKC03_04290, partial [Oscillospiraceae bacterium]|nr:hypothetical protein [Oscillospiraceae bacterium]